MKFNLLLVVFLSLSILSCGSDDDGFAPSAENFAGVYNVTEISTNDTEVYTSNSETVTNTYVTTGSNYDLVWTFGTNGLFTLVGSYTLTETFSEDGEQGTFTDSVDLDASGSYVLDLDNNTVLLSFNGDDVSEAILYDITTFTENTVELVANETEMSADFQGEYRVVIGLSKN